MTVLTMAYAVGHISGCHLNPAVSVGLVAAQRFPVGELFPSVVSQVAGAVAGAAVLYSIGSGKPGFDLGGGFASNGYGMHSPGGYGLTAAAIAEIFLRLMFLIIILGATDRCAPAGFAPIAMRTGTDADSSDRDSSDKPVGESGSEHRPGAGCGRLGHRTVVAFWGGAGPGSGGGRCRQ